MKFLGMSKGEVQSSKLLGNYHWPLDFPSLGVSMASLLALNSPNEHCHALGIAQFKNVGYGNKKRVYMNIRRCT